MGSSVRIAVCGALAATSALAPIDRAVAAGAEDVAQLEEVVVTAQRREQRLQDVPISVTALSKEQMDAQGVRSIDDVIRLAPGITFQRADAHNGAMSTISIRGIASGGGASTTGVYIDETPIQIRALGAGNAAFNAFPGVFDLDRVEVLRGPQGTLFGGGSEGGTVRFITPQPDLAKFRSYLRSEYSVTDNGGPSYEAGAALGGPIVEDRVGFRISGWYRRDSGWVDRVDWNRSGQQTYPPTAPTPASVNRTIDEDSNWQRSYAFKAALSFAPTDTLTITPSVFYQKMHVNDTSAYWAALSAPSSGAFNNANNTDAPSDDRFYLPALKVEWELSGARLVANTSYFNRDSVATNDYTSFETSLWGQVFTTLGSPPLPPTVRPYLNGPYYPSGFTPATSYQRNRQNNISQEVRLQSDNTESRLNWVVGLFYGHNRQQAIQIVSDPGLNAFIRGLTGGIAPVLESGRYTFVQDPVVARDTQIALYGQLDYKATDKLTLTAGLRGADSKYKASATYHGFVVGPPVNDSGSQHEKPVTPKFGASYKLDEDNMMYATAAKGYRIGGYNPRVGTPCASNPNYPGFKTLYDSDTVWSYEVGSKNDLLDNRLRLNTSAYVIDWDNIQQVVGLASCGFAYTSNLGKARSKGFDVQADVAFSRSLVMGLAIGYNNTQYTQSVKAVPTAVVNLVSDGDHIVGWPWSVATSLQYSFNAFGGRQGYVRADYQWQKEQSGRTPANNPANGGFLPWAVFALPDTNQLSARLGLKLSGFDVSVFANNLTNAHPTLSSAPSTSLGIPGVLIGYNQSTYRPRTFGVTAAYRY